jgi:hypothetical protein
MRTRADTHRSTPPQPPDRPRTTAKQQVRGAKSQSAQSQQPAQGQSDTSTHTDTKHAPHDNRTYIRIICITCLCGHCPDTVRGFPNHLTYCAFGTTGRLLAELTYHIVRWKIDPATAPQGQ